MLHLPRESYNWLLMKNEMLQTVGLDGMGWDSDDVTSLLLLGCAGLQTRQTLLSPICALGNDKSRLGCR